MASNFVDLHCHGGATFSYDTATFAEIEEILAVHKAHGTSKHILSLITAPIDEMVQRIERVAKFCASEKGEALGALGLHLEGPFISPLHKGAHDPNALANPEPELINRLLRAGIVDNIQYIKHITIAPELPCGFEAVSQIAKAGVIPAVGHSDCDYDQALKAFELGSKHMTHAFNAMKPIHHRLPGPVLAAVEAGATIEVIADGIHLALPIIKMLFDLAPKKICLVTDAMAAAGASDGDYMLGTLPVTVKDGKAVLTGTDTIAGSTLFLDKAVEICVAAGVDRELAIKAASVTPTTVLESEV